MASVTSSNAARKQARATVAALLDADDAERRLREQQRRKRIMDHAAEIAGNDAEIAALAAKADELRSDTLRRLAAIVGEDVSEAQAAAMTGREAREVKAAIKAGAIAQAPKTKPTATRKSAAQPAAV